MAPGTGGSSRSLDSRPSGGSCPAAAGSRPSLRWMLPSIRQHRARTLPDTAGNPWVKAPLMSGWEIMPLNLPCARRHRESRIFKHRLFICKKFRKQNLSFQQLNRFGPVLRTCQASFSVAGTCRKLLASCQRFTCPSGRACETMLLPLACFSTVATSRDSGLCCLLGITLVPGQHSL